MNTILVIGGKFLNFYAAKLNKCSRFIFKQVAAA